MILFAAAVFFLLITPGPGVLSTAGVGAGHGFRAGLRYLTGLFIGTNILYLLYLAARIAFAGSKVAFVAAATAPGIGAGILLQAINPKAYAVNTTLFAGFPYAPDSLVFETITKLLIVNAFWIPIHLGWLWAGASLHRLNLSDTAQRRIKYAMAAAMLGVVALALIAGDTR